MRKKEYITGTPCPSCNHTFVDADIEGDNVRCPDCGFRTTLRTPLERKREKVLIKSRVDRLRLTTFYYIWGGYLVMLAPLYLYLLFTDLTMAEIWQLHPVGVVVYAVITLILAVNIAGLIPLFLFFRQIRRHDYDIDWIRAYLTRHPKRGKMFRLSDWEKAVENMEEF